MTREDIEQKINELWGVIRTARKTIDLLYEKLPPDIKVGEMEQIAERVQVETGITVEQMRGQRRTEAIAAARAEAMRRIRQTNRYSARQIGRFFGDRDHTTVIHACRRAEQRRQMGKFPVMSSDQRVTNRYGQ
jgi:chromosomal replication initiator protein